MLFLMYIFIQDAIKHLKCALEVYIQYDKNEAGRALTLLGTTLKFQDNKEKAEDMFKKAMRILKGVI